MLRRTRILSGFGNGSSVCRLPATGYVGRRLVSRQYFVDSLNKIDDVSSLATCLRTSQDIDITHSGDTDFSIQTTECTLSHEDLQTDLRPQEGWQERRVPRIKSDHRLSPGFHGMLYRTIN
jgi:hypothetical protein